MADYRYAQVFIEGLEHLDPIGTQTAGPGARFAAVLKIGIRSLETEIMITSSVPDREITWSSTADGGQSLRFRLEPVPEGTSVELVVTYEEPGGIAGVLIAGFVEQTVQHRADTALERLGVR